MFTMNKENVEEKDFLREYVKPEYLDNAPEGFSERVMKRIEAEPAFKVSGRILKPGMIVPVISILTTLALIITVILIPHETGKSMLPGFLSVIDQIKFTLPDLKTDWLHSISLPSVLIYIAGGLMILLLFDRFLNRLFHNQKPA